MTTPRLQNLILTLLAVCCFSATTASAQGKPVKIFILAGQSNMQGQGIISSLAEMKEGYHEFKNGETYFLIGDAFGKAMKSLMPK